MIASNIYSTSTITYTEPLRTGSLEQDIFTPPYYIQAPRMITSKINNTKTIA